MVDHCADLDLVYHSWKEKEYADRACVGLASEDLALVADLAVED